MVETRISDISEGFRDAIEKIREQEVVICGTRNFEFSITETEMDEKYPHKCFRCKRKLYWNEFHQTNDQYQQNHETLTKLWKSPYVQLYCCSCFKKMEIKKKKEERLIKKAERICEKFGFELR